MRSVSRPRPLSTTYRLSGAVDQCDAPGSRPAGFGVESCPAATGPKSVVRIECTVTEPPAVAVARIVHASALCDLRQMPDELSDEEDDHWCTAQREQVLAYLSEQGFV